MSEETQAESGVPGPWIPALSLWAKVLIIPHAIDVFLYRVVSGRLTKAECEAEIVRALRAPLFRVDLDEATLWGCVDARGLPFLALTDPADEQAAHLVVRSCGPWHFWKEAKPAWVAAGLSKRGKWKPPDETV